MSAPDDHRPAPRHDRFGDQAAAETLELLDRALGQLEPIPPHLLEQAYAARFMTALDAELAELVFDSLVATDQPAMRRGAENEARFLSFANDHLTLDVSLLGDGRTIVGEIDPALATELVLEVADREALTVPIDQYGRFRVAVEAAAFRLRVTGHLVTPWISRHP